MKDMAHLFITKIMPLGGLLLHLTCLLTCRCSRVSLASLEDTAHNIEGSGLSHSSDLFTAANADIDDALEGERKSLGCVLVELGWIQDCGGEKQKSIKPAIHRHDLVNLRGHRRQICQTLSYCAHPEGSSNAQGGRAAGGTKKGGKKGKKDKAGGYQIKDALKALRATTYTAQALFDQIVSGDIDLDPECQRDVVWPEAKQVSLIDSIFRNFYIPPVIFAVSTHDDGSEHRICIDGKQCLTSINRFMLGLVYYRDRSTGEKLWYKDSSTTSRSKSRSLLPEKYRRLFSNKQIHVQLGMALTPTEKLGVVKSPCVVFIQHLQSTFFKDSDSALMSLAWDRSRGTDFRCLATILWCIERYWSSPANLAHMGSIQQLESFLTSLKSLSNTFKANVTAGFTTLQTMLTSSDPAITLPFKITTAELGQDTAHKNDKVSPIEFICICLLVLVWRQQMSLKGMAKAIIEMRRQVCVEHVDIRMNTRVGKTMITFVKDIKLEDYETEDDAETEMSREDGEVTPAPKAKKKVKSETPITKVGLPSKKRKCASTTVGEEGPPAKAETSSVKPAVITSRLAAIRKATQQHQTGVEDAGS
ncbi:hypothetical protein NP233_g282 [Leucocoprinus birnbaumii]|uniref:GmrSD restriction endonucleases N-terminal domain-containing protein n=1 Tax=Leucocoprinus birnbaumii TaxID=56174 RepID=A0AAD5W6Z6_9AGAR|nr:hypothetical protein NP233_g282 [Leucocoprinus birnbaumii]